MIWEWTERKSNTQGWKYFYYYVDEDNVGISVSARKVPIKGQPWVVEIHGYTILGYKFEWYERFNKDKILSKIENMIFTGFQPILLVIFDRIFNSGG